MTRSPGSNEVLADSCQRALGLALRRDADGAFALLDSARAGIDLVDDHLVQLADAVFLVARWTGSYQRGEMMLRGLLAPDIAPATRGWISVRMSFLGRPEHSAALARAALGEFAVAGDDAGQAMTMLEMAFPGSDLLPSAGFRLELVEEARRVGERLADPVVVAKSQSVRAALLTYLGDIDEAEAAFRQVWERFHVGPLLVSVEAANAALNHALALLSWGRFSDMADVLDRSLHIVTGPRNHDLSKVARATAMIYLGRFREARELAASVSEVSDEVAAFVTVIRVTANLELSRTGPKADLEAEAEFLESRSMQLGCLARITQADARAVRGEPRPHRDVGPALRRLAPSKPRFGWDGLAVTLAELAPEEAAETLEDMWDFWPAGPRPAVQRRFAESLLGRHDPYPSFIDVATWFESNGEYHPAARALVHASRVAESGRESLAAHKRAIELYSRTDAQRSIAVLLRQRRVRRSAGAPTIPESQRHAVNPGLTPREQQVAELAGLGLTGREIADRLGVSLGTARNHLQHVRDKLGGLSKRDLDRRFGP